jgi:HSP20 family protein
MPNKSWLPSTRNREVEPFRALKSQFDSLFEDWFGRSVGGGALAPRVDVTETDRVVKFTVELPGVEEKDIDVSLVGDRLTIKGEKRSEHEDKDEHNGEIVHRIERSYGSFQRTMMVPYEVDPDQVSAEFKDGVLRISLPKPEHMQSRTQPRRIEIKKSSEAGSETPSTLPGPGNV